MDSRQLHYFVAVAEELHFGRAAARLHMAQPPLSQQIRKLERALEARLFVRNSRHVALTREGEALLPEARRILNDLHHAEDMVQRMSKGEVGHVRLGFVGPAMQPRFAAAIRGFRQAHPDIRLTLEEAVTATQLHRLQAGALDVVHARLFQHDTQGLETRRIANEAYVLALPPGHPLAMEQPVSLRSLHGEAMVSYPRSQHPPLHDAMFAALRHAGAEVRVIQEAARTETILAPVAADCGLAIVPASARFSGRTDVVFRDIRDTTLPSLELWQVWRAGSASPALQHFLQHTQALAV